VKEERGRWKQPLIRFKKHLPTSSGGLLARMAPTERPKLGLVGPSRSLDVPTRCESESWASGLCRTLSDFRGRKCREAHNPKEGLGEEALRRSKREGRRGEKEAKEKTSGAGGGGQAVAE